MFRSLRTAPVTALTAAMALSALTLPSLVDDHGAVTFDDVVPGSTHSPAIGALSAAEIVNGFPDNTFRPSQKVSRAQTATMPVNWFSTLTI